MDKCGTALLCVLSRCSTGFGWVAVAQTAKQQSQASPRGPAISIQKSRAKLFFSVKNFRSSDDSACTTNCGGRKLNAHWKFFLTFIFPFRIGCVLPSWSLWSCRWEMKELVLPVCCACSEVAARYWLHKELRAISHSPWRASTAPQLVLRATNRLLEANHVYYIYWTGRRQPGHFSWSRSSSLWSNMEA